jgi:hypothetical protein
VRAIALIALAGCIGSLDNIRGGAAGLSVMAGDVATRGATGAAMLELRHGLRWNTELGCGRYPMEDGTHVAGGSFAESVGLNLTNAFDAPAVARWIQGAPKPGSVSSRIEHPTRPRRSPGSHTPAAGSIFTSAH